MMPATVMSGFKAAGVFPLDRKAIKIPGEVSTTTNTPTAVLARREGIRYMPFMFSTEKKQLTGLHDHEDQQLQKPRNLEEDTAEYDITYSPNPIFSDEEEARFARRYENGYDLKHDKKYNLWLGWCMVAVVPSPLRGGL